MFGYATATWQGAGHKSFPANWSCGWPGGWLIKSILLFAPDNPYPPSSDLPCWHLHSFLLSKPNQLVISGSIQSSLPFKHSKGKCENNCLDFLANSHTYVWLEVQETLPVPISDSDSNITLRKMRSYGGIWKEFLCIWLRSIDTFLGWLIWLLKTAITLIGWLDPHTFLLMATAPQMPECPAFLSLVSNWISSESESCIFCCPLSAEVAGGSVVRDSDGVLWQMSTNKLSSPCPQIRFLQSRNSSLVK